MTSDRHESLARALDPEAWTQRPDRKWSYYRRRRAASLAAADRAVEWMKRLAKSAESLGGEGAR